MVVAPQEQKTGPSRGCMARDAELDRLKSAIPELYQPAQGAGGRLTNDFSSVDSLRESTPLQGSELERFNLGMGFLADAATDPDASNPNFLLTGSMAVARDAQIAQTEQHKRESERRFVIAQLREQIEARNRQIEENLKRYAALERQDSALSQHLDRLRRGEKADLDTNGKLRDAEAEAAIREYEDRYGVTVDRNDADQIAVILQGIRDEKLRIMRENEDLAADNERDRKLAIDMGAKPESIPATVTTLEASQAGQRSLDNTTTKLGDEKQRQTVVDTIFEASSVDHALAREHVAMDAGFEQFEEVVIDGPSAIAPPEPPIIPASKLPRPSWSSRRLSRPYNVPISTRDLRQNLSSVTSSGI